MILELEFWQKNIRPLGILAIIAGAGAWALELTGAVYVCPYCRVQRTVIIILGTLMLLPFAAHWLARFAAFVIGFLGAVVAVNQNFMGWARISKGEFEWGEQWYFNPFLLSGFALVIICAQVGLLLLHRSGGGKELD